MARNLVSLLRSLSKRSKDIVEIAFEGSYGVNLFLQSKLLALMVR